MRKASSVIKENKYEEFPYTSKSVCFIEQTPDGKISQVPNYVSDKRAVYYRVKYEGSKLFAAWPGNWTTDLFEIDDIEAYGKANRAETYNYEGAKVTCKEY